VAVAFVQAPTPVITASVTSLGIAYASNVTAANTLLVFARAGVTTPTITCTDNLGDGIPWRQLPPYFGNNTPPDKAVFAKVAGASGPCTVTITGQSSGTIRVAAREYSGVDGGNLAGMAVFVNLAGGTTHSIGPTPDLQPGLVVAGAAAPTNTTLAAGAASPNSNLVKLDANASGLIGIEDEVNWPGGPATATFTTGASATVDGFVVGVPVVPIAPDWSQFPKALLRR
jgi:hypothetical protein